MRKEFLPSLILSVLCIALCSVFYPLLTLAIARMAPGKGEGCTVEDRGKKYYRNIAQKYTEDKYFQARPSAVDYNAAGSGGSNKGPANPDYLAAVQQRIDTFLAHNPKVNKRDISSELVSASGSGLDPDISVQGAMVQVERIASARGLPVQTVVALLTKNIQRPLFGILGPEKINVLILNITLDHLKQ